MIRYFIAMFLIQLLFLLLYDFVLKKETFFRWNRGYLLTTTLLSLLLPLIEISSFETQIPEPLVVQLPEIILTAEAEPAKAIVSPNLQMFSTSSYGIWQSITWVGWLLIVGMCVNVFLLLWKFYRLHLIGTNAAQRWDGAVLVCRIPNSSQLFSFWNRLYVGDNISTEAYAHLVKHEMVHIRQRHSLDMLFFELLRVLFWFNPLVYIYQNRMRELHEFLADAVVEKQEMKKHFQLLLSSFFGVEKLSFVHTFYNNNLIKKRIAMLKKQKSKPNQLWKYLTVIPTIFLVLFLNACEQEMESKEQHDTTVALQEKYPDTSFEYDTYGNLQLIRLSSDSEDFKARNDLDELAAQNNLTKFITFGVGTKSAVFILVEYEKPSTKKNLNAYKKLEDKNVYFRTDIPKIKTKDGVVVSIEKEEVVGSNKNSSVGVPFAVIDEAPVFPGCEGASDLKKCFIEKTKNHIRKHFNYPAKAKTQGIQGRVAIMFTIARDGTIKNIRKRGPHELLEAEAVRIIKRLPKMKPGRHNGNAVSVPFSVPITFKIH